MLLFVLCCFLVYVLCRVYDHLEERKRKDKEQRDHEQFQKFMRQSYVTALSNWQKCIEEVKKTGDAYNTKISASLRCTTSAFVDLTICYNPLSPLSETEQQQVLSLSEGIYSNRVTEAPLYLWSILAFPRDKLHDLAALSWTGNIELMALTDGVT